METQITINTPALLFPAITLLMLAYTNRFLALATLIRNLHGKYKQVGEEREIIRQQIHNLKKRLLLVKQMQGSGITSFFLCVLCMFVLYEGHQEAGKLIFGASLITLMLSLVISLREIQISVYALRLELLDLEAEELKSDKNAT